MDAEWEKVDGEWDVLPLPPLATWDGEKLLIIWPEGKNIVDGKDIDIYNTNDIFPSQTFCRVDTMTIRNRNLAQATVSATRFVRNVLFYEGPTTQNFSPQVFVDISTTLDRKIKALQAHHSQIKKTNIEDLSIIELATSSANFRGIQGRVKYAEAFHALRLFINV